MRLSMQILADWLKDYSPRAEIAGDSRVIRNVRPLSDGHSCTPNNVYVSANEYNGVMCINRNSILQLPDADTDQITNEIMDAFDYYNNWQDDLTRNLPELTLEELLRRCQKVLPGFLAVADPTYYTLAYEGLPHAAAKDSLLDSYARTRVIEMPQILDLEQDPRIHAPSRRAYLLRSGSFHTGGSVRNLFLDGRHLGWLIYSAEHITPGMMDLQDEVGDLIESWLECHAATQEGLSRNSLLFDLLSGNPANEPRIAAALLLLRIHEEDEKLLCRIELSEPGKGTELLRRVNALSPCCHTLFFRKGLVCLISGAQPELDQFESKLAGLLLENHAVCGVSMPFRDIMDLAEAHRQASAAVEFGISDGRITHFSEVVLPYTLQLLKESSLPWLIHPAIGLLQEYDARNHTELGRTLWVYLQAERNYADTARTLNIHRNSLLYRIERIHDLTGLNLDDADTRLHLLLSFKVQST